MYIGQAFKDIIRLKLIMMMIRMMNDDVHHVKAFKDTTRWKLISQKFLVQNQNNISSFIRWPRPSMPPVIKLESKVRQIPLDSNQSDNRFHLKTCTKVNLLESWNGFQSYYDQPIKTLYKLCETTRLKKLPSN